MRDSTTATTAKPFGGLPSLHFHLMHPGGASAPGDPNAAFFLDGVCHLHYILRHPFRGSTSYSFVHVSSPDMLHWTWHETVLQPSFTGHGMFSGTGFMTREGRPGAIYHGQGSGKNWIALARDNRLSAWEKPFPITARTPDGREADIPYWDPDCFLIGDTYYAISGGQVPPLMRSWDLRNWTHVGDFLAHNLPDVALGEDISCPNFFPIGDKWMLLCISHPLGCRYYLGDWDAQNEQFVPRVHARMNWRRAGQSLDEPIWRDFFAPESVLTPDGRRVMWAWLCSLDPPLNEMSIQSLPRELRLADDGTLRITPLRELSSLRGRKALLTDVQVVPPLRMNGGHAWLRLAELPGTAVEVRIVVERAQAERKRFGFFLFGDGGDSGLPILIEPGTGTLRVGDAEAPFVVADLPPGEDVNLRVFIDEYLVEVFANERQAMVAAHLDYNGKTGLDAYTFGAPTILKSVEIWELEATDQGAVEARKKRIWAPSS